MSTNSYLAPARLGLGRRRGPGFPRELGAWPSALMGPANRSPGIAIMGAPVRAPHLAVMGGRDPVRQRGLMGAPDPGPRVDVMGDSDPRFVDSLFAHSRH
jgi:hypothetical protein